MTRTLLAFALLATSSAAIAETALVTSVLDGDTIQVRQNGEYFRIRLADIDAPEKSQPFGANSATKLRGLLGGRTVEYVGHDKDRYGRIIATVKVSGVNVNRTMACTGHAWAYRRYLRDNAVLDCEIKARRNRLGLWSYGTPTAPWVWRHNRQQTFRDKPGRYAPAPNGSVETSSFPNCSAARAAGKAPISYGQPGYSRKLDRDGDGVACE